MVEKGTELRKKAALYRRLASIPTAGGHGIDRILVVSAEQLEHAAQQSEDKSQSAGKVAPPPLST